MAKQTTRRTRAKSPFARIEDAIAAIKRGEMIIVVDDEDRENEGDLTIAAEKITPAAINFMARHGRGLICMPMTEERLTEKAVCRGKVRVLPDHVAVQVTGLLELASVTTNLRLPETRGLRLLPRGHDSDQGVGGSADEGQRDRADAQDPSHS